MNDSFLRTIDKCDNNCKTCINRATKCLTCNDDKPYLYLSKCLDSCDNNNFFDENGIKKCFCYEKKCKYCSEESMQLNLCESCNEGYYPKIDENFINNFTNCYKDPEKYYLNSSLEVYIPCYPSCKYCDLKGNDKNHYCISCNSKNSYPILMKDDSNYTYFNCYPICIHNFYFDENNNYKCLEDRGCPSYAPLLIDKTKQCVKECNLKNKYMFRNTCFEECPKDSKNYTNNTGFYCISDCPFERPFEILPEQICVSSCTIMERYNGLCITNYEGNRTADIQNMILLDIKSDIIDTFDYSFITRDKNLIYKEKNIIYEITSTQCQYHEKGVSIINLGECESILKEFYCIEENEPLYILKFDAHIEGSKMPEVEYETYYPIDGTNLKLLDLSFCEGKLITIGFPKDISNKNMDLYNKNSGFYNDICYTYTNENGTDVTLQDRQKEFTSNNRSLCEENCEIAGYDESTKIFKCT